jgi:acyl dehydratase
MTEVSTIGESQQPRAIEARITDADIDRQRRQIGIPQHTYAQAFNWSVSGDVIRHYAFGFVGDDNPLWHDPDYGTSTRWRSQIAPPLFASSTGLNETPAPTPEMKALFKGLYRGVGRYNVGTNWSFFLPIRPGDQLYLETTVDGVEVKETSSFAGGRTVLERYRHLYVNNNGEPIAVRYESFVNAERGGSRKVSRHSGVTRHVYSSDEIAQIDAVYSAETVRGADERWWEDVEIGDDLVPVVKGPLGMMDIIAAHVGWGIGPTYGAGPLRYGWKNRQRIPAFYVEDKHGVPSPMMRVHWDQERCEDLGLPAPYDYGQMRSNWLAHLVTNWMGDDAWVTKLATEIRMFNFHGDTTLCSGRVVEKRADGEHHLVDLELQATNQRQEITVTSSATVLLPSRAAGAVVLPRASQELVARGAAMMTEAARCRRS